MLPWMPFDNLEAIAADPRPPDTRFSLLRALFGQAYATLPDWVWCLPQRLKSDEVLRHVAKVAASYTPDGIQRLHERYGLHPGEVVIVSALAGMGDELEASSGSTCSIPLGRSRR